jgi:hypothetical protein
MHLFMQRRQEDTRFLNRISTPFFMQTFLYLHELQSKELWINEILEGICDGLQPS